MDDNAQEDLKSKKAKDGPREKDLPLGLTPDQQNVIEFFLLLASIEPKERIEE